MKYLVISVALLAFAVTAFAGGNPNVKGYLSFDQTGAGGQVHEYTMAQYVGFNVYVCLTDLDMGMDTVSFMLTDPITGCPGLFASASFTNLLPGNLAIGAWNTGITIASTDCMTTNPVVVGYLNLFPIVVGEAWVSILDHPEYPGWVVDCTQPNGEVDFFTVLSDGSINGGTPVEDATWGGIKALYR